jgi:hypothetical protein
MIIASIKYQIKLRYYQHETVMSRHSKDRCGIAS